MSNFLMSWRRAAARCRGGFWFGLPWWMALAASASPPPSQAACLAQPPAIAPWSEREAGVQAHEQLSDTCLKRLVRQCDAEAEAGFLDGSSAATCSLRYEALLRQGFRGDFNSFLRWWQAAPPIASQH